MTDIVRPGANRVQRRIVNARIEIADAWSSDPDIVVMLGGMGSLMTGMILGAIGAMIAGGTGALIAIAFIPIVPLLALIFTRKHLVRDSLRTVDEASARQVKLRKELRSLERCSELAKDARSASLQAAKGGLREAEVLLIEVIDTHERAEKQYALLKRIAATLELSMSGLVGAGYAKETSYYSSYEYSGRPHSSTPVEPVKLDDTRRGKLAELGMSPETLHELVTSYRRRRDVIEAKLAKAREIELNVERVIDIQTTRNAQMKLARTLELDTALELDGATANAGENLSFHLKGLEETSQIEARVYTERELA